MTQGTFRQKFWRTDSALPSSWSPYTEREGKQRLLADEPAIGSAGVRRRSSSAEQPESQFGLGHFDAFDVRNPEDNLETHGG